MLQINLLHGEILEEMTEAQICRAISLQHVEVQRLKKQTTIKDVAWSHIIAVALNRIRPRLVQVDGDGHWLLVPQEIELDRVTFELSLDHFLELGALAFQLDVRIAGNRMAVDR